MRTALALFILLILTACGKNSTLPEGFTKVIYSGQEDDDGIEKAIQANLTKGLIVYALNTNNGRVGARFAPNIGTFLTSNQEVFLPNGPYKFFAVGYDSSNATTAAISADFFCGEGNNGDLVFLNGGTKSVNITLLNTGGSSSAACQEPFAGPAHRNGTLIKSLTVKLCAIGSVGPGCTSQYPKSYRLVLGEYDSLFNTSFFNFERSIKSCHATSAVATNLFDHFPLRIPFRFKLESFNSTDCSGAPVRSIAFEHGIEASNSNADRFIDNSSTTSVAIGIGV